MGDAAVAGDVFLRRPRPEEVEVRGHAGEGTGRDVACYLTPLRHHGAREQRAGERVGQGVHEKGVRAIYR